MKVRRIDENEQFLRPPFCRMGSKFYLAKQILGLFPNTQIDTYVEPFIGSGAVFWRKSPHNLEVINDLDPSLIENYKLLKDISPNSKFRTDLNTAEKLQSFLNTKPKTDANILTHAIVKSCNTLFDGNIVYPSKNSNPHDKLKNIKLYQDRLKGVKILNQSYEKIIDDYDSDKTFFYLDPPYELEGKVSLYEYDDFNQEKLRDKIKKIKGYWLLSINDSENIRDLYKGFYFLPHTVVSLSNLLKNRKELFIANYKISDNKL